MANTAGVQQWKPLCVKYFGSKADECLLIMKAESGGNPKAKSATNDHGLMQIHAPLWPKFFKIPVSALYNPDTNVKCARVIYDRAGGSWKPWTTSRKLGL